MRSTMRKEDLLRPSASEACELETRKTAVNTDIHHQFAVLKHNHTRTLNRMQMLTHISCMHTGVDAGTDMSTDEHIAHEISKFSSLISVSHLTHLI